MFSGSTILTRAKHRLVHLALLTISSTYNAVRHIDREVATLRKAHRVKLLGSGKTTTVRPGLSRNVFSLQVRRDSLMKRVGCAGTPVRSLSAAVAVHIMWEESPEHHKRLLHKPCLDLSIEGRLKYV